MAQARSAQAINPEGAKLYDPQLLNSTEGSREDEVSKIFITSLVCVCRVREPLLFTRNGGADFRFSGARQKETESI